MSTIKDRIEAKKEEEQRPSAITYSSVKGVLGSKGAFIPKSGLIFKPEGPEDIEILEYFVEAGIVDKIVE